MNPLRTEGNGRAPGFLGAPRRTEAVGYGHMHTIELTDEELRLVRAALTSYLEDFGHEEADLLRAIKAIIARLPVAG